MKKFETIIHSQQKMFLSQVLVVLFFENYFLIWKHFCGVMYLCLIVIVKYLFLLLEAFWNQ